MTGPVLVAVVIAAAVVGAVAARRFGRSPSVGDERAVEPWLVEARSLVDEGRRVSDQVAGAVEDGAIVTRPGIDPADPSAALEALTQHLAEISAAAPTKMDVRVCRSLAVRSKLLSEVLRTRPEHDPTRPPSGRGAVPQVLDDRRHEFDVALRDLAEHVELL